MNRKNAPLLPSGLYDLLPPDARTEAKAAQQLLACFESFGYAQVSPPLLEFEASLLAGRGEALAAQTFRVMDPMSQAMMGFRADMTLQVARIATTRMESWPRPLRLCYAGTILRVKPDSLRNERQLLQAGIELIGTDADEADAEVMLVAAEALMALGISGVSIDINLPGLLRELCPEADADAALRTRIKDAVQRRDAKQIAGLPLKNSAQIATLLEAAGPVGKALEAVGKLSTTHASLGRVVARLQKDCPQLQLTIDPLEYRGFDYHQGIGFSLFAQGLRHELGRGGRYMAAGESATGFTLYVTHLMPLLKSPEEKKSLLVPQGVDAAELRDLRAQGWATVYAMTENVEEEARRLGVKAIWVGGKIKQA